MHFVTKEQIDHLSGVKKKEMTRALFMNPKVIDDLREAAEDNELLYDEEEIMHLVHKAQNDR
ncbi:hypothetical protein DNH61_25765 [Paenibacillus sambharensis]|uniref:Uncharacterized protein n=1 Tax=Paenibacillus sambharensis TaxID=1803190 RepID=A0A2W1L0M9_9BACL|nr:hypothetical protein [Paenibacillus sambharensis]PZD92906.1 hypothetical protein DNH61_25765 [Paenibacillus sambharensis]